MISTFCANCLGQFFFLAKALKPLNPNIKIHINFFSKFLHFLNKGKEKRDLRQFFLQVLLPIPICPFYMLRSLKVTWFGRKIVDGVTKKKPIFCSNNFIVILLLSLFYCFLILEYTACYPLSSEIYVLSAATLLSTLFTTVTVHDTKQSSEFF